MCIRDSSDIKKATGKDPGILGSDFMFITDKNNPSNNWYVQQENKIIQDAKSAYTKGMINTFCWHLREPYNETSFYASDMTAAQKADAFKLSLIHISLELSAWIKSDAIEKGKNPWNTGKFDVEFLTSSLQNISNESIASILGTTPWKKYSKICLLYTSRCV